MTTTMQKTEVKPTWTVAKMQEETAASIMRHMVVTFRTLEKSAPNVLPELWKNFTAMRVEYFKQHGVKTPLELVKAMSEFETNLFGSKMRFWGDDKQAGVEYETCGCWNAMPKVGVTPEEQERMGKTCAENTQDLAKTFGFKGEIKIGTAPNEPCCTMIFTK